MPRKQLLSSAERDSLLALPDDELAMTRIAFLSEQDIALIHHHRGPANRLGFAVLLCYLRYPGFIPDDKSPPDKMLLILIARQLKLSEELWAEYATRAETRWEHLSELYRYLNLTPFSVKIQQECVKELTMLATRTDKGILLAEALVTHLRRNYIILPSIDVLERTCAEAVAQGDKVVFAALNNPLSQQHKEDLDSLLLAKETRQTPLNWLLQPPGKINGKNVLQHIDRLKAIEALALPEGIERHIHQNRLLKLAREGRKMSAKDLSKFTPVRRYATMVCILTEARATLIDEIIELHERIMNSLFSKAKRTQAERLQQSGKIIQGKLRQFLAVGQALLAARESGADPFAAIEQILPWPEFMNSLEETRSLAGKENYDSLHLITEKYSTLRKYAPRMLATLQMTAAPAAEPLADALGMLNQMYEKQLRKVPDSAPVEFIPERWRKLVMTPAGIDRQYYEFCFFSELKGALRAGDIWVKGSHQFKNFDEYLIPQSDFSLIQQKNSLPLAITIDYRSYIHQRLELMKNRLAEVERRSLSGDLPDAEISDKGLRITPLDNNVPEEVETLSGLAYRMLPHPKITEILVEVDNWTNFTRHFTHLKNNSVVKDKRLLLTALLADAINLGLSKMAESCPGMTYARLAHIQAWYIRDETHAAGLAELINAQSAHVLAQYWGDGTTSSSDGQNFRVGSHGKYAGHVNLKYGQEPGVQFYTHISDQYGPYHSQVISRVRDSTHVLDGLLYHESDLQIQEHYTDTAGFTDHVFALMHLLGFRFAPRIRDLHDKRLYVPDPPDFYPGLKSIISRRLNLKVIQTHWNDILRLATSIKQGTVTASLMLKKLGSYPRQNGLAVALRELGRMERTLFMLDWILEPGLRRRVQIGLNKGEARNALARAVFFNRLGEIRDRSFEQQRYRASGLNLVTAAIILWNTVYLERTLDALRRKGYPIDEALFPHFSPLGWEHINLTGDYIWRNNQKLGNGKFRPLRPLDIR